MHLGRSVVVFMLLASFTAVIYRVPASSPTLADQYRNVLSSGVLAAVQQNSDQTLRSDPLVAPGQDVRVTTNLLGQNEPSIGINPTNNQNFVVGANDPSPGFAWLGVYASLDAGSSWTPGIIPHSGVLAQFEAASDPSVMFDRTGTLYYSGLAFNVQGGSPTDGSVFVSKSTNGGLSFVQTTIISQGSTRVFNDKPYASVDMSSNRILISWTRFTSSRGDIMVSHSDNGGLSFSSPVRVSTSSLNQGSVPTTGPSGNAHVVWNDLSNNNIMEARSTNAGVSFSSPILVSSYVPLPNSLPNSSFRTNNNPTAAVDSANGNVYLSWSDYSRNNSDIMFSRSTDNGTSWTSPTRVNDDNTNTDQFYPWVTVAQSRIDLVFYDRRLDSGNHLMDLFSASSSDGGVDFSTNSRVSDVSFDPDAVVFSNGQSFIGDYVGVASNGSVAYAAWTDTRDVSTASPQDENIYEDRLVTNAPPTLEPIPNKTVDEGTKLTFEARASDPDTGESLTLSARGLPFGANFSSTASTSGNVTGIFTWTPDEQQGPGNYAVGLKVSDGFSTTSLNVSITVLEVNSPPVLSVPQAQKVDEGSTLTFMVYATDSDIPANNIVLSCDNCFTIGASFDAQTGIFTWVPSEAQGPGSYDVAFVAGDDGTPPLSDMRDVRVQVNEVNQPAHLFPVANETIDEGSTLSFNVSVVDPDTPQQTLVFSLGPDAPEGASISKNGLFSWTPSETQGPRTYTFTINVSDGSLPDSEFLTVVVNEVDNPPILVVPGPQTVETGALVSFTVGSSDPNLDTSGQPINTVSLTASGLPDGSRFDPKTGIFVWTPSDSQGPRSYTIVFSAVQSGGTGLSETKRVSITVLRPGQAAGPSAGPLGLLLALAPAGLGLIISALMLRRWRREDSRKASLGTVWTGGYVSSLTWHT